MIQNYHPNHSEHSNQPGRPGRKPVMMVGPVGAGKSTLIQALASAAGLAKGVTKKTEAIIYSDQTIDTPGEMVTIPHFYNALILNSVRAGLVLFLMDGNRPIQLPPRLALAMKAPVMGVVSKIDLAPPENLVKAKKSLTGAGVKEIVEVSSVTGQGLVELNERIAGYYPVETTA